MNRRDTGSSYIILHIYPSLMEDRDCEDYG